MNLLQRASLFAFATACWAGPITITNASFESPALIPGGLQSVVPGWTLTGLIGVYHPIPGFLASIPDGNQILGEGAGAPGEANQSLGVSLIANTTYTLTYFVGRDPGRPLSLYSFALQAGSTVLASDSGANPGAGLFVQRTITFTTGGSPVGGTLNIDISATGTNVDNVLAAVYFDEISLSTPGTPEPASVVLLAGGLLGVVLGRKRLSGRV